MRSFSGWEPGCTRWGSPTHVAETAVSVCQHVFCRKAEAKRGGEKKGGLIRESRVMPSQPRHSCDFTVAFHSRANARRPKAFFCCQKEKAFILQFFQGLNPQPRNSRRLSAQFILWFCLSSANPRRAFVFSCWGLLISEDNPPTHLGKLWEKDALAGVLDTGLFTRDSTWFLQWCFLWVTRCLETRGLFF